MATDQSKYNVTLTFSANHAQKTGQLFTSETVWCGLDYAQLVAFEAEMLDAITGALKRLGLAGIEALK